MSALKPSAAEDLAGAARQLGYALDQTSTTDDAFQKLYAVVAPDQRDVLRQLETLLRTPESGTAADRRPARSAFQTLAWLLHQTTAPERSAAALFAEFRRHESFGAGGVAIAWGEFSGFLGYLGCVLAILIVVISMYATFVVPQFAGLYGGFGQELPTLTSAVFGHGASWFACLLLFAVALLVLLAWYVFYFRRQFKRYLPMPAGVQKVPLVGAVAIAYNRYLWLSYTGLLRAAGMPPDQALKVAAMRLPFLDVGQWSSNCAEPGPTAAAVSGLLGELAVASRLDRLGEEAQFQQEATLDAFLAELARCRRRTRIVVTIFVYGLVAIFVSGMYLPIFSLGSAI